MLKAGEARCAITPMNGMTVLGYVSRNGKGNGEEPNDKPRKVSMMVCDVTGCCGLSPTNALIVI